MSSDSPLPTKGRTKRGAAVARRARRAPQKHSIPSAPILEFLRVDSARRREEKKDGEVKGFEVIRLPSPSFRAELALARGVVGSMFGPNGYRTRLGENAYFTTDSSGRINVSTSVSGIGSVTAFSSFAALFDEFFVHSMTMHYEPYGQYIQPPGVTPGSNIASTQMYVVSLYHGTSAYAVAVPGAALLDNATVQLVSSGRPWSHTWTNNENPRSGVVTVSTTSSPPPTQSWCLTPNASVYTGIIQVQAGSTLGPASATTFGLAAVMFDVSFRARA